MSADKNPAGPTGPQPQDDKPAAAPAAPATASPAAPGTPAAPAKNLYPRPVFSKKAGKLLKTRLWPTEAWEGAWSQPDYRNSAIMLAALLAGIVLFGVAVGELSTWSGRLYRLMLIATAWLHQDLMARGLPSGLLADAGRTEAALRLGLDVAWAVLKGVVILGVINLNGLWAVWFERKVSAHMQSRLGPMYAGGFHGWAQTILDSIKLLLKEDTTPQDADAAVHRLAPAIVIIPAVLAFAPVLFGKELAAARLDIGVLYILAVSGISVIGVVMAGWSSGNKYSLLGGLRAAAQVVSYEIPRLFAVVPVLMFVGSLDLSAIDQAQQGYWGGVFPRWFVFYFPAGPLAFLLFLIASVAETNRVPFDIPEAESELVAGFMTEYSGMKWALFFLAEYAYVLLACFMISVFFLGGGAAPLPFLSAVPSWIWMLAKAMTMMFVFMWLRWTLPRFRVDQLMDFNWKFLLPWSFANVALAGAMLLWR
ncbi:MAG: NADH-quinone oxidoreductase subunit NuoH [Elusimicrobia bacterium]|nr:NADH-quinone oxidoreductase subunit NuoH [Elusimicrobiota bacterium]